MSEVSGIWNPENAVSVIEMCERLKAGNRAPVFRLDYYGRKDGRVQFIVTVAEEEPKRVFLSASVSGSGALR